MARSWAIGECKGGKGVVWLPTRSTQGPPQPYWIVFVPPPTLDQEREGPLPLILIFSLPATPNRVGVSPPCSRFKPILWGPTHFRELVVLLISWKCMRVRGRVK